MCLAGKSGGFAWAAFAGEGVGGPAWWDGDAAPSGRRGNGPRKRAAGGERAELAGGEGVEGAEAIGEFGGGEALLAVEAAEEIARGPFALLRVALGAARDEVAIRVAAETHARHNMIETLLRWGKPAQTVEAEATLAGVDGLAKRASLQEVGILERQSASLAVRRGGGAVDAYGVATGPGLGRNSAAGASGANFFGEADLDEMTGFGTFDQTQSAEGREAADGFAGRSTGNADSAGEPLNGEAEPQLRFETAVAQEMGIDGAVEHREAQLRDENVFHLLPDFGRVGGGIGHFVCHVFIPRGERWWTVRAFEIQGKQSRAALPGELAAPSRGEDLGGRGKKRRTRLRCGLAKTEKGAVVPRRNKAGRAKIFVFNRMKLRAEGETGRL